MEAANKVNVYKCEECGHETVTVNRDEGVTPFMIKCRAMNGVTCKAMARSLMYRVNQNRRPDWEWYRPDDAELTTKTEEEAAHVKRGGLLIRKLDSAGREYYGHGSRQG